MGLSKAQELLRMVLSERLPSPSGIANLFAEDMSLFSYSEHLSCLTPGATGSCISRAPASRMGAGTINLSRC